MADGELEQNETLPTQSEDRRWAEEGLDNFGEYCFETDQLALKGNDDYQALLRTMVKLEVQRMIAIENMEKLEGLKNDALKNALQFVEKLQRGEDLGFPLPQIIPDVSFSILRIQSESCLTVVVYFSIFRFLISIGRNMV